MLFKSFSIFRYLGSTDISMKVLVRGLILFFFGVFFSLVLNLLQVHRELLEDGQEPGKFDHYESSWWVLPACGMTAGMSAGLS